MAGWCFPDTESGILFALERGATHLWANTILFASHPLQISPLLEKYQDSVRVIGQSPLLVETYDDKEFVNNLLRYHGNFTLPKGWSISETADLESEIEAMNLPYPIVAKPIRGRGSHGVKVCHSQDELLKHIRALFKEFPSVMMEEYLAGEEATVSVMPPSKQRDEYWAMPIVTRLNHADDITPYNGVVAVTGNSRVISQEEYTEDPLYAEAARQCEAVAKLLGVTALIRIDIRRFGLGEKFAIFDVNMKPVSYEVCVWRLWTDVRAEYDGTWASWEGRSGQFDGARGGGVRLGLFYPAEIYATDLPDFGPTARGKTYFALNVEFWLTFRGGDFVDVNQNSQ